MDKNTWDRTKLHRTKLFLINDNGMARVWRGQWRSARVSKDLQGLQGQQGFARNCRGQRGTIGVSMGLHGFARVNRGCKVLQRSAADRFRPLQTLANLC